MGSRQVEHFDVAEVESSSSGEDEEYLGPGGPKGGDPLGSEGEGFLMVSAYFEL
jgi:hypothetical protein